jgi:hypothetical protein
MINRFLKVQGIASLFLLAAMTGFVRLRLVEALMRICTNVKQHFYRLRVTSILSTSFMKC